MHGTDREILKAHKIKYSKQRCVILHALMESELPQTADQIYAYSRSRLENMSFSTVYRILNAFVSAGLASKTNLELESKALFELDRHEHKHHLLCIGCNQIIQISSCPVAEYEKEIQRQFGYSVLSHKLEIYGYCPQCQKKMAGSIHEKEGHHHE